MNEFPFGSNVLSKRAQCRMPRLLATLLAMICQGSAVGSSQIDVCLDRASNRFGALPPNVLKAIMQTESSFLCTRRHPANRDGSYDIGCMGINSHWLPILQQKFHLSEFDLYDSCTNIHVGAWIYAHNIQRFGNTWQALGAYNALNESKRVEYTWKIYQKLTHLQLH